LSAHRDLPGYWMHETSGRVREAVAAYLAPYVDRDAPPMTGEQIATMRAYLRQWIAAPAWRGPLVDVLRTAIDELTTREAIERWIDRATDEGIDPL
jgi:hypothetical protein